MVKENVNVWYVFFQHLHEDDEQFASIRVAWADSHHINMKQHKGLGGLFIGERLKQTSTALTINANL